MGNERLARESARDTVVDADHTELIDPSSLAGREEFDEIELVGALLPPLVLDAVDMELSEAADLELTSEAIEGNGVGKRPRIFLNPK